MNNRRVSRISEEIKKELSEIIQYKLKDPRIPPITTVSYVDVTRDLSFANIGISVLGNEEEKENAIEGLKSSEGFIKKELGNRLKLRAMPKLIFGLDESIEKGMEMQKLINEVNHPGE